MLKKTTALAIAAMLCATAMAAPKIESVVVKPNPAEFSGDNAPEVQIAGSVSRTKFDKAGCDARLDFGDGEGRNIDFSAAATRTMHHVYTKDGSYTVSVRGAGATPCDGAQRAAVKVAGEPKPKPKPEAKKAKKGQAKKKAQTKKDESK